MKYITQLTLLALLCSSVNAQNFQNVVQTINGYKGAGLVCNETFVRVGETFVEKPKDNYFKMSDDNPDPTHDVLYQLNAEGKWEKVLVGGLGKLESTHYANGIADMDENQLILGQCLSYYSSGMTGGWVQLHKGDNALILIEKDSEGIWNFKQDLIPEKMKEHAKFGCDVELLENEIIAGSWGYKYDAKGKVPLKDAGAVFVYGLNDENKWYVKQIITLKKRESKTGIGYRVESDGNVLLVSYYGPQIITYKKNEDGMWDEVSSQFLSIDKRKYLNWMKYHDGQLIMQYRTANKGSAETVIYEVENGQWVEKQRLLPDGVKESDKYGQAVAIHGNYMAISAHFADENGRDKSGAVYIFEKTLFNRWHMIDKITMANPDAPSIHYGETLAMNSKYLFIGCKYEYRRIDVIKYN